ncbi:aspartate--tRNA ligase [Candidatus Woesearchaeota archaeon]|nr:aspartate--tRNA ligase [Candidatus Woesearchaeota archaeon]
MTSSTLRSHTCGELNKKDTKKEIKLCGWVNSRRDHGGIIFIDLRDRYGFTQIVLDPKKLAEADKLRREWCIQITGLVRERPKGMENKNIITGEIEVEVKKLNILNESEVPPFEIDDRMEASEELRLKYRYLDLRRPVMQERLLVRHKAAQVVRQYLSSQSFMEIETPMFVKTTPGGARVFKVPSRTHTGKFYSLPESPQMYKQILMVAGCDRYFQLARCLRDEDLRVDRQPEFTQIDIEMSFIDREDIYNIIEGLLKDIFKKVLNVEIKIPFLRLSYQDTMSRYGSDKPDLRFELELKDVSSIMKNSEFGIFKNILEKKGVIYCLNAKGCGKFSRTEIEELIELGKTHHLPGLAWIKVEDKKLESSIVKYLPEKVQKELIKAVNAKENDLLLFAADEFEKAVNALGQVRLHIGKKLNLMNQKEYKFCWVTDFPLFEWNEEVNNWQAKHHIFTMPLEEDMKYLETDPSEVKGKLYDIVLNGVEIGGGSIRIHKKEIQARTLQVTGLNYEEAEKKFDFLLNAFKFSAPPHGGIAIGFDRLCALLCGINDIREVIAFPKNKAAENPMDGSPQDWTPEFLKELNLKLDVVKKN